MKHFLIPLILAAVALSAQGRTWTSATDAKQKFEGDFVSLKKDQVTVKLQNGKTLLFPITALSKEDQAFARTEAKKAGPKKPGKSLDQLLAGKLVKLKGDKLADYAIPEGKAPKYYLFYVSAYW